MSGQGETQPLLKSGAEVKPVYCVPRQGSVGSAADVRVSVGMRVWWWVRPTLHGGGGRSTIDAAQSVKSHTRKRTPLHPHSTLTTAGHEWERGHGRRPVTRCVRSWLGG